MSETNNSPKNPELSVKQQLENQASRYFSNNEVAKERYIHYRMEELVSKSNSGLNEIQKELIDKNPEYIVKKWDNLHKIAKIFNLSFSDLLKYNPWIKNPNLIKIGQKIFLTELHWVGASEWKDDINGVENIQELVSNSDNNSTEKNVENNKNFPKNGIYLSSWDIKNAWWFADWNEKSFDFNDAKIISIDKFHPNKVVLIQEKLAEFWLKIEDVNIYEDKDIFSNSEYVITQKNDDIVAKKTRRFQKNARNLKTSCRKFL